MQSNINSFISFSDIDLAIFDYPFPENQMDSGASILKSLLAM